MKIRNRFVSNSSSSSFVIPKDKLTAEQIQLIFNHSQEAEKHSEYFDFGNSDEYWSISESEYYISGYTFMDNFDMYEYLVNFMKIEKELIHWDN